MIKFSVQKVLLDAAAVTAEVGSGEAARIYYVQLPQKVVLPAIRIAKISNPRDDDLDGASGTGEARVQVDCWAKTATELAKLVEAVIAALQDFRGEARGLLIDMVRVSNETDFFDDAPKDYRTSVDFLIDWRALPS